MAEPLDFDKLFKKISADDPSGPDLRDNPRSVYYKLKAARETARTAERRQLEQWVDETGNPGPPPNWDPILELAPGAIATESKDLQIAAWLAEALVRKHHFEGLLEALKLISGLVERFWDNGLHPNAEKHGLEDSL